VLGGYPPPGVTVLGGARKAKPESSDETAVPATEESGMQESAISTDTMVEAPPPVAEVVEEAEPALVLKSFSRCHDLTWAEFVLATRMVLLKYGRIDAVGFLDKFQDEYGCALIFPFFGYADWFGLIQDLQPGTLAIVAKRGKNFTIAASNEAAFAKEHSAAKEDPSTAWQWQVSQFEVKLKAVRQSINERRRAQKDAEGNVEKISQEYQKFQSQKSANTRALKADLQKQEQRVNKFRSEAEEFEVQEKSLLAEIAAERKAAEEVPVSSGATHRLVKGVVEKVAKPVAQGSGASEEVTDSTTAVEAEKPAQVAEEDFM